MTLNKMTTMIMMLVYPFIYFAIFILFSRFIFFKFCIKCIGMPGKSCMQSFQYTQTFHMIPSCGLFLQDFRKFVPAQFFSCFNGKHGLLQLLAKKKELTELNICCSCSQFCLFIFRVQGKNVHSFHTFPLEFTIIQNVLAT